MPHRRDFLKASSLAGITLFIPRFTRGSSLSNRIREENARPGTNLWQLKATAREREIEGYASATSVNAGETIRFYVHTPEPSFTLQIFRLGWYGGLGGRAMTEPVPIPGLSQPVPQPDPVTGLIDCNWQPSYSMTIPTDWVSGGFVAKIIATDSGEMNWIPFIVREDDRPSDLLFQSSVTTNQAYNNWGGKSLYAFNSTDVVQAKKVSFNRPYIRGSGAGDFVVRWEYNMIRFLEREGYDVRYSTNIDTHLRPLQLLTSKAFLSVGHDEYWSREMREHVTAARDRGIHLGFFSANTCYWKIRLESGADGSPDRTIVAYKESAIAEDPMRSPRDITYTWRHAPTSHPEESLIGVMYIDSQVDGDIVVTNPTHWVFSNTGLRSGDRLLGLLGYEVDRIFGSGPPGVELLARSPYTRTDRPESGY